MDYEAILRKILRRYGNLTENVRALQVVESKLKLSTATYADAQNYAVAVGQALKEVFREYLPEALTDGKLYRAAAEVLVEQPMKAAGRDVGNVAKAIQQAMNDEAGIGMNAIVPDMNLDQIDGIITGICNAESYASSENLFLDQIENFLQGHVDDFVHDNAQFQSDAGLTIKVERILSGSKPCEWCKKLAGTYDYDDVSDRGNDVWRRHVDCKCMIVYDPRGSKRLDVYNGMTAPRRRKNN